VRHLFSTLLGVAFVAVAAPALPSALAQEPPINGHTFLPEASWGKLQANQAGQKLYVIGRWELCFGNQITLFKGAMGFFYTATPQIQQALAVDEVPGTNPPVKLVGKKSRVQMFGQSKVVDGKVVFLVESVTRIQDDVGRIQALVDAAKADPDRLKSLADEAKALGERFEDADLMSLYVQIVRLELELRRTQTPPTAHAQWLILAERYAALNDMVTAITAYSHVESNGSPAEREQARARLKALGAVSTSEGWVPFARYKTEEGFIERAQEDGRTIWVRKEEAEFDDAMAAEKKLQGGGAIVIVRANAVQHGTAASAGRLERGQTLEEARVAAGQPVTAFHRRAPDPEGRPALWTQWIFADGRRAYFLGNDSEQSVAISVKTAKEAWPTR
jgi:hypothetical protein